MVWIGPDLEKTYGKELVQLIYDKIPPSRRLIWDTRGPAGRPDVVKLLQDLHNYWEAEGGFKFHAAFSSSTSYTINGLESQLMH